MGSKDLLEQLRTVHFALLLLCLATVVVILTPDFGALSMALEQVRDLSFIKAKWSSNFFEGAIADGIATFGTCVNAPRPITEAVSLPAIVGPFNLIITRKWDLHYEGLKLPLEPQTIEKVPILRQPKTVQDFKNLWDARLVVSCPRPNLNPAEGDPAHGWDVGAHRYAGTGMQTIHLVRSNKPYPIKNFIWRGAQPSMGWDRAGLLETSNEHWWWVIPTRGSPTDLETHVLRMQNILQRLAQNRSDISDAPFDVNFPNLKQLASDQQAMSLDQLQKQLESKLAEANGGFTAFSIKFPTEVSRRWAVFFIVIAQLYFSVHFAEYCRRGRPSEDVAWIGAYDRIGARLLTWATVYVLPVVVVSLAAQSRTDAFLSNWGSICTAVSASISVLLIVIELRSSRRSTPVKSESARLES